MPIKSTATTEGEEKGKKSSKAELDFIVPIKLTTTTEGEKSKRIYRTLKT